MADKKYLRYNLLQNFYPFFFFVIVDYKSLIEISFRKCNMLDLILPTINLV